ncbi:hypothetical protein ACMFMG_006400 [Clarireedia jacksonii]
MHSTSKTTALCKIHTADFKEYITCLRRLDEFEILVSRPITITSEEVVYPRAGSVSTTTKTGTYNNSFAHRHCNGNSFALLLLSHKTFQPLSKSKSLPAMFAKPNQTTSTSTPPLSSFQNNTNHQSTTPPPPST